MASLKRFWHRAQPARASVETRPATHGRVAELTVGHAGSEAPIAAPWTVDTLLSSAWWFGHSTGLVACEELHLLADGTLGGYDHPHEKGWVLVDGQLAFTDAAGGITTLFDRAELLGNGQLQLSGAFRLHPETGLSLVLRQVPGTFSRDMPTLTRLVYADQVRDLGWEIGDHTYGTPSAVIMAPWRLVMGRYCSVAAGVVMVASNHRTDTVSTYPFVVLNRNWRFIPPGTRDHTARGDIVVGNDVWIAAGAFIASGVTIGDGAVVAAMSVVTRDVPPYAIVGGNPARVIRHRFAPDVIEQLLRLRWWDWPDAKVEAFLPFMLSDDIERFLREAANCARPIYRAVHWAGRTA